MARALWKGWIDFGMVSVPVKLYMAVRPQDIQFHMLHDQDGVRVRQKLICPAEKKEIPREHILKGYEVKKDEYVIISDEEIEAAAPVPSREIRIREFVDLDQIDPLYFEKAYYLGPDKSGEKSYAMLVEALKKSRKIGIAELVMRGKEYLAALRVIDDVLCLEMMRYHDEVVSAEDLMEKPRKAALDERELRMAEHLIDALARRFDPDKYRDEYRSCVMEMVEKKARGEEIAIQPAEQPAATKGNNLMKALEASIAQVKGKSSRGGSSTRHRKSERNGRKDQLRRR